MTIAQIKELISSAEEFMPKEKTDTKEVICIALKEFMAKVIPPREMLLSPIIPTQGLVMLYALRGIGKTQVSLSIALAVASGKSLFSEKWKCKKPSRVLFIDGEMPANVLQERLAVMIKDYDISSISLDIITPDMQEFGVPNLSEPEGQAKIEQHIHEDTKLIILDNLSTLCRSGKENDEDSWKLIQEWVLKLRSKGKSVLFIHHSNKGGSQRGTSKKEDILDTVITLKRPQDYQNEQGARFEVHYEKSRGFYGDDAKPFEAWLNEGGWKISEIEDAELNRVIELHNDGLKQRDIATETGLNLSKVNRLIKKAEAEKLIEIRRKKTK
ncbi:MAG: AAA family ATPase [Rickettsiales bacterium]|nr:AAA family ATPase [Rickettsiales bacterium]